MHTAVKYIEEAAEELKAEAHIMARKDRADFRDPALHQFALLGLGQGSRRGDPGGHARAADFCGMGGSVGQNGDVFVERGIVLADLGGQADGAGLYRVARQRFAHFLGRVLERGEDGNLGAGEARLMGNAGDIGPGDAAADDDGIQGEKHRCTEYTGSKTE